jgi:octaprenyl-diphosphate synthase
MDLKEGGTVLATAAFPSGFQHFQTPMHTVAAVAHLRETAQPDRVGPLATRRLADVHAMLGTEMGWIEAELRRMTQTGLSPAVESAQHLLDAGGKRVRPLTVLLSAACVGSIPEPAKDLAVVAELVHLATLLHDDVVDDAPERRGKPAARILWGNAVSVLAGDLLLTHALERTSAVAPRAVLADLFATLRRLVDGEIVQLRGRTELDARRATYFTIVQDKTASLFGWAARAGAAISGAPEPLVTALGEFGAHVGVAFQLVDDLLDYEGDPALTGKCLHTDLREGKLTLPLILAVEKEPSLYGDLLAAREMDAPAAARLVAAVRRLRTGESVRAMADEETRLALQALALLPESPARDMLSAIATELTARAR